VRARLVTAIALASMGFVPASEPPFVASGHVAPFTHRHTGFDRAKGGLAGWRGTWDRDTGMPIALWGKTVAAPGAMTDPTAAERVAREQAKVIAPGADFVVARDELTGALRTVTLQQVSHGLPVIGGQLAFVFGRDRLFAIEAHVFPAVHASERGGHAILPVLQDGALAFHAVDVAEDDHWIVYRLPGGGELLRTNKRSYATGTLTFDVGERYATGPRVDAPAPQLDITVDGTALTTGLDGSFTWTGAAPATVVTSTTGTLVDVIDAAGSGATATLTVQPGGSTSWSLATDEFGDAQLATYIYGNIVKARDRLINPALASWFDAQFPFTVNDSTGACNAYATATGVHFYQASAQCQNTGRLADIVFHEFGHAFHYNSYLLGGSPSGDLSEGLADFNAANILEDPDLGRGFFYNDDPVRQLDPPGREWTWPQDVVPVDFHQTGLIIGGALWDLRAAFVRDLGHDAGVAQAEGIFAGILQRAADIPSTYMAALVADDDDADLGNGTPHGCTIERAFGRHGLAPGYQDTVVAPPVVDGTTISVAVTPPTAPDCPASQITAIHVRWHAGSGAPATFDLAPGTPWTGAFPSLPPGTLVGYTVEAERDDGTSIIFPQNPGDPEYQLFIGPTIPIWCEPMDHDPLWTQDGNYPMEWNWGMPTGAGADPTGAHTGDNAFGTQVGGNGQYRASTATWAETPAIDTSVYASVHLQYWRWLTIEDRTYDAATIAVNGQPAWQNPISPQATLNTTDREWRFQDIDLTPYITDGTAQVRWSLTSDSSNQYGGWTLDDVCIVALAKNPLCGDGVLDDGEQCDDGNTTSGDGCSTACIDEPTAGGGGCNAGGGAGWLSVLLGAVAARGRGRRGRSRRGCRSTSAGRADRRRS
jgi:cysteine-rich repeat protein